MFIFAIASFSLLSLIHCLICPIYNIENNQTEFISSCEEKIGQCSFLNVRSKDRRCLGIYRFDSDFSSKSNRVRIRQLAIVDDLEQRYVNRTDCILNVDKTGQNLLCRCNSDNCTLKSRTDENFHFSFFNRKKNFSIEQKDERNFFFPLIFLFVFIVLIVIGLIWIYSYRNEKEKDNRSLTTNSTNFSNFQFEQILSTCLNDETKISQGTSNDIYRITSGEDEQKIFLAVKIYRGEQFRYLFENEVEILRIVHHSNIIKMIDVGFYQLSPYIVLEYHQYGSLNDYLKREKISWLICFSFLQSFLRAVDFLHYEDLSPNDYFTGNRIRKAIIVHRDIKSSNLLVKSTTPLSLCLTDFGLGKILPPTLTPNDFIQIGTYRYMAPELLELAISHTSEALCKVDIYAVGLVMWEIVTQCEEYPIPVKYQLPYEEFVNINETNDNRIIDILHRIVVEKRIRPTLHRGEKKNSKIDEVFRMIDDCWKHEPESRINVRSALSRLRRLE